MATTIRGVRIDDEQRPYIIAEASGNHNQDYTQAEALVRAAAQAGADAIKFQTFTAEEICADIPLPFGVDAQHDAWLREMGVSRMRELFAKGGLPRPWHAPLKALADSLDIAFLSTPFSVDAARFLVDEIGVPAIKIASGDLTFTPLLEYAASTGLPVILSTGGATMEEIGIAEDSFYASSIPGSQLAILHCCSVYPAPSSMVNLRAIGAIRRAFVCTVGFSDHTLSVNDVPMLAVACGATILEKHIRLSGDFASIDTAHSLDTEAFATYVQAARMAPAILGHGRKEPHERERHDRLWARRDPSDWLRPEQAAREGQWA